MSNDSAAGAIRLSMETSDSGRAFNVDRGPAEDGNHQKPVGDKQDPEPRRDPLVVLAKVDRTRRDLVGQGVRGDQVEQQGGRQHGQKHLEGELVGVPAPSRTSATSD